MEIKYTKLNSATPAEIVSMLLTEVESLDLTDTEKAVFLSGFMSGISTAKETMLANNFENWTDLIKTFTSIENMFKKTML